MNVFVVEPGKEGYVKDVNGLKEMQEVVGGDIESLPLFEDGLVAVCNEEGRLLNLPRNKLEIYGTFFICKEGADNFKGITPGEADALVRLFNHSA